MARRRLRSRGYARCSAQEGGAVVMPIVTGLGGKLVVVTAAGDGTRASVVDLPDLTPERLAGVLVGTEPGKPAGWIGAYFINYLDGEERSRRWPEWTAAIDGLGPQLWRLFAGRLHAALREGGVKTGTRVFWLPSGWLGILPLGLAQDPASKRRFIDDYEIVYAPSLEALAAAHDAAGKSGPATLAAIVNPTGDLPGTGEGRRDRRLALRWRRSRCPAGGSGDARCRARRPQGQDLLALCLAWRLLLGGRARLRAHHARSRAADGRPAARDGWARPPAAGGAVGLRDRALRHPQQPRRVRRLARHLHRARGRWRARHLVAGVGCGNGAADRQVLRAASGRGALAAHGAAARASVAAGGNQRGPRLLCEGGGRARPDRAPPARRDREGLERRRASPLAQQRAGRMGQTCCGQDQGQEIGRRRQARRTALRSPLFLGGLHLCGFASSPASCRRSSRASGFWCWRTNRRLP